MQWLSLIILICAPQSQTKIFRYINFDISKQISLTQDLKWSLEQHSALRLRFISAFNRCVTLYCTWLSPNKQLRKKNGCQRSSLKLIFSVDGNSVCGIFISGSGCSHDSGAYKFVYQGDDTLLSEIAHDEIQKKKSILGHSLFFMLSCVNIFFKILFRVEPCCAGLLSFFLLFEKSLLFLGE